MNQPDIGYIRIRVGDLSLLSQAYSELHAAVDAGRRSVSEPGLQRLRAIIGEIEALADYGENGVVPVTGVWSGVAR